MKIHVYICTQDHPQRAWRGHPLVELDYGDHGYVEPIEHPVTTAKIDDVIRRYEAYALPQPAKFVEGATEMTDTVQNELLPCPFCVGASIGKPLQSDVPKYEYMQGRTLPFYFVKCTSCGASPEGSFSKESAIEQWNTRTPAALPVGDEREAHFVVGELVKAITHAQIHYSNNHWLIATLFNIQNAVENALSSRADTMQVIRNLEEVKRWKEYAECADGTIIFLGKKRSELEQQITTIAMQLDEARKVGEVSCQNCGGYGYVIEGKQDCCGNVTDHGECRGHCSIEVPEQVQCEYCYGTGATQVTPSPTALVAKGLSEDEAVAILEGAYDEVVKSKYGGKEFSYPCALRDAYRALLAATQKG